jgi:hypothetical protein
MTASIHQDVSRFKISVHHTPLVRMVNRLGDGHQQLSRFAYRESTRRHPLFEIGPINEIAGNEHGIAITTDLMHAHNVRVLQLGGSPRIPKEELGFFGG